MPTEQSPLLTEQSLTDSPQPALPTKDIHDRFTNERKRVILAIVSLTGFIFMLAFGCFIPSIPQISKDIHSTPTAVSLGVSLSVLSSSLSIIFLSAYSSFYGRRVVYIYAMPFTIIGSFAVAMSTEIYSLLFWRFVQTFGCADSFALAAAVIGDIYRVEERGSAMGTFFAAMFLGVTLAPPLGGLVAQYWSWRAFHAALGVLGMIELLLLIFFLPETAHPGSRGVDKVLGPRRLFTWINPFRCIAFLRGPNILAVTLASTFALAAEYTLVIPIAFTIGKKYGITSEGTIGILNLPNGIGNFLGALIAGRVSDWVVRRSKEERKGVWVPEDRLRAVWIGGLVLVPVSVTLAGFTTTYIDGPVGLVINLVCLFFDGAGVHMILTPLMAYIIDIVPSRSAEAMAAVAAFRSLLVAPMTALLIPSIETVGVAATNTVFALLVLVGYALIWLTIRYGKQMRAYVDVGYPNFDAHTSPRDARD